MKKAQFVLTLVVTYESEDGQELSTDTLRELRNNLDAVPHSLAGNGVLTARTPEVAVDVWQHQLDGPREAE